MKNIIVTLALVIIGSYLVLYQTDVNQLERESYIVKDAADSMASAAGIELEESSFALGHITYDYDDAVEAAKNILMSTMNVSQNYEASADGYFRDDPVVDIYFFNENGTGRHYQNGIEREEITWTSGVKGTDYNEKANPDSEINYPGVMVIYYAGHPRIKISSLANINSEVFKTSVYEYKF